MRTNTDSAALRNGHNANKYLWTHLFSLRLLMISFAVLAATNLGYLYFSGRKLGREAKNFAVEQDVLVSTDNYYTI